MGIPWLLCAPIQVQSRYFTFSITRFLDSAIATVILGSFYYTVVSSILSYYYDATYFQLYEYPLVALFVYLSIAWSYYATASKRIADTGGDPKSARLFVFIVLIPFVGPVSQFMWWLFLVFEPGKESPVKQDPDPVTSVCPIFDETLISEDELNLPTLHALVDTLTHFEARTYQTPDVSIYRLNNAIRSAIHSHGVRYVIEGEEEDHIEAWYMGYTKNDQQILLIQFVLTNDAVQITVYGDDPKLLTEMLATLHGQLEEQLAKFAPGKPGPLINISNAEIIQSKVLPTVE